MEYDDNFPPDYWSTEYDELSPAELDTPDPNSDGIDSWDSIDTGTKVVLRYTDPETKAENQLQGYICIKYLRESDCHLCLKVLTVEEELIDISTVDVTQIGIIRGAFARNDQGELRSQAAFQPMDQVSFETAGGDWLVGQVITQLKDKVWILVNTVLENGKTSQEAAIYAEPQDSVYNQEFEDEEPDIWVHPESDVDVGDIIYDTDNGIDLDYLLPPEPHDPNEPDWSDMNDFPWEDPEDE